jgi:hypothetical protein
MYLKVRIECISEINLYPRNCTELVANNELEIESTDPPSENIAPPISAEFKEKLTQHQAVIAVRLRYIAPPCLAEFDSKVTLPTIRIGEFCELS